MKLMKRYLPVLIMGVALVVSFALAVPTFTLNVQNIGEGENPTVSPVNSGASNFVLSDTNPDYITAIKTSFDQDLPAGTTIYAKVYDASSNLVAKGSVTLGSALTAGTQIQVDLDTQVKISDAYNIAVVVLGPEVSP